MLLVLGCAVLLLFIVPWMLFGLGRLIEKATDGPVRAAATETDTLRAEHGAEQAVWFRQPMRPAFSGPSLLSLLGGSVLRR